MTAREKGVATRPCPTCGTDLPVTEQPDGGMATATCPKCFDTKSTETASRSSKREKGTDASTGDTTTTEES